MKKILLFTALLIFLVKVPAQDQTISGNLEVQGQIKLSEGTSKYMFIKPSINNSSLSPGGSSGTIEGASITNRYYGHLMMDIYGNDLRDAFAVRVDTDFDGTLDAIPFIVNCNGKVGIGTTNPSSLLTVKGAILASQVQILHDSEIPSSDYVFEADYMLLTLKEVEQFVKTNKHLPEVPSAAEFKENGYSVGEMDDILLRKVEELTLYIIGQQKLIEQLQTKVEQLENH